MSFMKLYELTDWPVETLLSQLGSLREPYGPVLVEMAELADGAVSDRRRIVMSCAQLTWATGDDPDELRLRLHEVPQGGGLSPAELLGLGEVSVAFRRARIAAGLERDGRDIGPSPWDGAPPIHLSLTRVDLYVRGERALLGERVCERIDEHIKTCEGCQSSVKYRKERG